MNSSFHEAGIFPFHTLRFTLPSPVAGSTNINSMRYAHE
jgi:hypothetical protein